MKQINPALGDQFRQFIESSEMTRYLICKNTGIDQGTMSRFMAGRVGLSIESLERLTEFLGLKLVKRRKPSKRKGR